MYPDPKTGGYRWPPEPPPPLDADLQAIAALSGAGFATRTGTDTWALRSIAGTTNQITVANGSGAASNPTISISTSYAGQASITTLGTVGTGTWNATTIGVAYGGTGATSASGARTNLGLGSAATESDTKYAHRANNLSDLSDAAAARTNLGVTIFSDANAMAFSNTGATDGKRLAAAAIQDSSRATASAGTTHYRFYNPNGLCGSIQTNASETLYNTSSDERLKENFVPLDAGALIDTINAYTFDWKSGGSGYGVKAQECYDVFPDAVSPGDEETPWAVDYSKFVPLLLAEVKALRARVAALEATA